MDLRDYFALALRHWPVLTASVLAGLLAAGIAIWVVTPQYESTAKVVFTAQNAGTGQDIAYAGNYVQGRIQTYKDLATSQVVLDAALSTLDSGESADELAGHTDIGVSQIDTIVDISVRDPKAAAAAEAANAIADALIAQVTVLEGGQSPSAKAPQIQGVVVGPAEPEDDPATPNKPLYLSAGLLAGLLVGIAVVSVRHVLQDAR